MDADIVNLVVDIGERIDVQWALFITVHMAILGVVIYIDKPMLAVEKVGALVLYSGFAYVNYVQMNNQLGLAASVYADAAQWVSQQPSVNPDGVMQRLVDDYESGWEARSKRLLLIIHVVMAVVVFLTVLFDKALVDKRQR